MIVTASYDRKISFWEGGSGRCIRQLPFGETQINAMSLSPDKQKLAAAGFASIKVFDLANVATAQGVVSCVSTMGEKDGAHITNVTSVGFIATILSRTGAGSDFELGISPSKDSSAASPLPPGELLYSVAEDGFIKFWDVKLTPMKLKKEIDTKTPLNCAVLSTDQRLLFTGSELGFVSAWNVLSIIASINASANSSFVHGPLQEMSLQNDDMPVRTIAISPFSNLLCVGTNSGTVHCFTVNTQGRGDAVGTGGRVGFKTNSTETKSSTEDASVHEVVTEPGSPDAAESILTLHSQFQPHSKYILKCALSPDGKLLAVASADYTISLWNVPQCFYTQHTGAASPEKELGSPVLREEDIAVAAASQSTPIPGVMVRTSSRDLVATGGVSTPTSSASPQFNRTVSEKDGTLKPTLKNPNAFTPSRSLLGHQRWVWDCAFSACSRYLVTVSSDHTGRLWDLKNGNLVIAYTGHSSKPVTCVVIDERGTQVMAPGKDK